MAKTYERAFLLAGFNNWGKSEHINMLFAPRVRYSNGRTYHIAGFATPFVVESHSNDDYAETDYLQRVEDRVRLCPIPAVNFFGTLCPTRDGRLRQPNDSRRILTSPPFSRFAEVHLLLLKYKWDWHAQLRLGDISTYLSAIPNLRLHTIDADQRFGTDATRLRARDTQIRKFLGTLII